MIAIFGDYSYWNDGIGWSEFSERGTEKEVITQAVERWLIYREEMRVHTAIGVGFTSTEAQTKINQVYQYLVGEENRKREITQLNTAITNDTNWLANVENEKAVRSQRLAANIKQLEELR